MTEKDTPDDALPHLSGATELDSEVLERLYRVHADEFRRRARAMLGDADDVVEQVFLRAWERRSRFDSARGSIEAWLFRIFHNEILNSYRSSRFKNRSPRIDETDIQDDIAVDPEKVVIEAEQRDAVRAALSKLPASLREVLTLQYFEGSDPEQIAQALGITVRTTYDRLLRARQFLRAALVSVNLPSSRADQLTKLVSVLSRASEPVADTPSTPLPADSPLARSQAAFQIDLPELLGTLRGKWVAYANGERVWMGDTQRDGYRHCLQDLGLTHDRFVVRRVAPEGSSHVENNPR